MVRSNKKKLSRKRTTSKSKKPQKHTKKQNKRLKQPKKTKTRKSKRKTRKLKRKSRKLKGGIDFNNPIISKTQNNPLDINITEHHSNIASFTNFPELKQIIYPNDQGRVYFYFKHNNDKIYLFQFLYNNNFNEDMLDTATIFLRILKDNTKNEEEQYVDEDLNILTTTDIEDGDFFNELNTFINENLKNKKPNTLTYIKKNELQKILTDNILNY
uniref:Uncharacterized protein n=1 Tax=viral metagenome TaxID=1070528 RepID=A0A6C0EKP0_9ZZZZ